MERGIGEERAPRIGYPRARRVERLPMPRGYSLRMLREYGRKAQAEEITGPWTFQDHLLMKAGPKFDVKAWGAKGDNSADDTRAFRAAVQSAYDNSEAGIVFVPPLGSGADDRYKITGTIDWKGSVCFLGSGYYSRITAHVSNGAFPIIQSVAGDAATQQGVWMKGLTLGFEDYYDDADAKCIAFIDGDPYPRNWTIEDCTLRNGYYGFYDSTGGFLGHLRRVWAYKNRVGFYKHGGGGGHNFDTCFSQGKSDPTWDLRGFDIDAGVGYTLQACAMDGYDSPLNGIALFANNHVLTIIGFSFEANEALTAGNCIIQFDENHGVVVTGMKDIGCVLNTDGGDNTRLVSLFKERIHFSGCELGAGTVVIAAGAAAEGYTLDILGEAAAGMSRVTVTGGAIVNPGVGPTRTATTISFDSASKEIRDSAEGLNRFATGLAITVSGSVGNDGAYTIATGGVGAKIVVNEALGDEAAGAEVTVQITDLPDPYAIRLGTAVNTIQLTLDNVLEDGILNPNQNKIFDTGDSIVTNYICVVDEKPNNTNGGTLATGAWRTRDLNTERADTGGLASLAANQITLPAGTYRCRISCPAYHVDRHKARIKNMTDAVTLIMGTSEYADAANAVSNRSFIVGRFTLTGTKALEIQHYCQTTQTNIGMGVPSNFNQVEVYTIAEFWKEA